MRQNSTPPRDVERELARLDHKLLDILEERAAILAAMRAGKKGRAAMEQHLEQRLWQAWEERAGRATGDKSRWRTLFTLIQDLPAARHPEPGESTAGFQLFPKPVPCKAQVLAPAGVWESQCWAALAVQCSRHAQLRGVAFNAALAFLVKALNHAGATIRWNNDILASEGGSIKLDGKALFVGDDALGCYFLLFLALGQHIRLRVTGDTGLKLLDLSPVGRFLQAFQARLTPVVPGSKGLPARLESAGLPPAAIQLPSDLPPEALLALAMAAPSYEEGLSISWKDSKFEPVAARAAAVLASFVPDAVHVPGTLTIPRAEPTLPPVAHLPMDPLLAVSLLALPLCHPAGGDMALEGAFPAQRSPWKEGLALLRAAGGEPEVDPDMVRVAVDGSRRGSLILDTMADPACFPLSFALAAARMLQDAEATAQLSLPATDLDRQACEELAARLGLRMEQDDACLRLTGRMGEAGATTPWLAPTAAWGLAYACLSMARPGLALANPGGVTELLPRFWNLFNTLPQPPRDVLLVAPAPMDEENADDGRGRKRRIKLRGDITPS
ncbi:putative 5-enolpyruvylshikimate-3-phosphate synthase-like protein [Megalodesulfovibrio gigas DSM 1382 = ATCC 19364]|uniref:Putative 5-enolpyruvylshikimate-3-phosphate synthase-like protein n=1 Tax=Megalodesulfovibrio gigas (strain ATCC 19364 / DSM 1382 / NCIMB 9332 / VKM B-1759) TaxID=1121448 RepID=T2G862_MEGG1|nr:putative 5-enolpyruvylshikimate-3-phosphate synthase-like protein [Megalodesulfovibrio gigas DSM 1382 = ATCC 19364]